MRYFPFLSLLAIHFILVSSAFETRERSESTEEVSVIEAIKDEVTEATDVTEKKLYRTRLTASLHEEFIIVECTIESEEDLDSLHSTLRDQGNERSACCDWIVETASKLLHTGDGDDDAAPSWTTSLCARHLAAVPTTSSHSSQVGDVPLPSQLATYMFLYPRRIPETANGFFPPPTPPTSSSNNDSDATEGPTHSWTHFAWSTEASGTGEWLVNNERRPAVSIVQDNTNIDDDVDANADAAVVETSLRSTLSEAGGMHRDFHHVLQLGNIPTECQRIHTETNESCTFSVWILLYLPADVFINTEDAFSSNHPNIDFQIYTADHGTELIDQEEPAFASPWHVVLVHLRGPLVVLDTRQMHSTATAMVVIEWDTFLHIRYPSPVVNRDFARMHVLAPQLVNGGFLQSTDTTTNTTRWKMMMAPNSNDLDPAVLSTWAAVGREEDYPWIVGLTMVAATFGAAVMLRDISRVAVWS
jgi:hypothetical protein